MTELAFWAVIPAAGVGSRIGAEKPKQYLTINNKTIIEHALQPFCDHKSIKGIVVVTAADDDYWPTLQLASHDKIMHADGGKERCHSVLNGLYEVEKHAGKDDWVLVHDAARPCLKSTDIDTLISALNGHPVGGTLAMPVRDTMKRTNEQFEVTATVEREHLWHAMTPQMFHLDSLKTALQTALDNSVLVTDETQAIEGLGMTAKLVACGAHNIKVTRAEDIALAQFYLGIKE